MSITSYKALSKLLYLQNVTSDVQTQLNARIDTSSTAQTKAGALTVQGTFSAQGAVSMSSGLSVNGSTSLGSTTITGGGAGLDIAQGGSLTFSGASSVVSTNLSGGQTDTIAGVDIGIGGGNGSSYPNLVTNTIVGKSSLSVNVNAYQNSALGYEALKAVTSGGANSAVGYRAGYSLTTGTGNNYIGYGAGYSNTAGSNNVAIGNGTLFNATGGQYNTAIGDSALTNGVAQGSWNTAVGANSLLNNTASWTTAVGFEAMKSNTSGGGNSAFGAYALAANTTGYDNLAVGGNASASNTTGYQNTAIGRISQYSNVGGYDNTSVGFESLKSIIGATSNTAVGSKSLRLATNKAVVVSVTNGGSGYINGTYTARTASVVSGTPPTQILTVNVTVSGGAVTSLTIADGGYGYPSTATTYTVSNTLIGGTGTGFVFTVAALADSSYNTSVGESSLTALTSGSYNTAIGTNSLYNLTSGSENIAIGSSAASNLTSGSNNVFIGYNPAGSFSVSNSVYVGSGTTLRLFVDSTGGYINGSTATQKIYVAGDADTASTASKLVLRNASGNITGKVLISDVAQGTAPLTVTSNIKVANLNADLLDDQDGSYYLALGNATGTLATGKGGTGLSSIGTSNQILGVNTGGTGLEYKTVSGTNITVANAANSLTVSIPQSVATTATPTFAQITINNTPSADTDVATKGYVDATAQGLDIKASVRVATTANITLSGTQTVDGVTLVVGDRVLVKNQTTGSQNGIYVVASGAWTRATDADTSAKVTAGMFTFVEEGTANADGGWTLSTNSPITLGTTALVFTQFSGAGQVTAGAGLTKTGNTVDIVTASSSRIVVNPDSIDLATVADSGSGTFKKITVDLYGRVSGTAAVTSADISAVFPSSISVTSAYASTDFEVGSNVYAGTLANGTVAFGSASYSGMGSYYFTNSPNNTSKTVIVTSASGLLVGDVVNLKVLNGSTLSGVSISNISGQVITLSTSSDITNVVALIKPESVSPTSTFAFGANTIATGAWSVAFGSQSVAEGNTSFATGSGTRASGANSASFGYQTIASGNRSFATGISTIATGSQGFASGNGTQASGANAFATGVNSHAYADNTFATGWSTRAEGTNSSALGLFTTAQGYSQTVIGQYNVLQGTNGSYTSTDKAFIIGNGTSTSARSNALAVDWTGNVAASGAITATKVTVSTAPVADGDLTTKSYVDDVQVMHWMGI